jgi:hypothetical protein
MKTQMKILSMLFVLGLLLGPVSLQAAAPAILQEMPGDCQIVVATQPLAALSKKVQSFAQKAQLQMNPNEPLNLAEMIADELGIPGQVDGTRGAGLCVQDVSRFEQTMVAFLPVLNSGTAVTQMGAQKAEGISGIWTLPDEGVFLKPAGKYLLVAENSEMLTGLAQRPKGVQLTPVQQELFSKSDAAGLIKLGALLQQVKPMILGAIAEEEEIQKHPAFGKIITMAVDRLVEVDNAALGVRLADEGISVSIQGQAQANSTLAKYLSNHPMTDTSVLGKLPKSNFIFATAAQLDYKLLFSPFEAIIDAFAADTSFGEKLDPAELKQLKSMLTKMGEAMGSGATSQALYMPEAGGSGGMKVVELSSHSANMTVVTDTWAQMCPLITRMTERAGFKILLNYQKNAGTVEGLSYDEFSLDLSELPIPAEAMQGLAMAWGGQAKLTEQICNINPNLTAVAMGPGAIQEAVKLGKSGQGGLNQDPAITKTAQHLPPQANMLGFVNVGPYLQWAMSSMMPTPGGQPGMNPMAMLAPMFANIKGTVGVSAVIKQGRVEGELFLPTELVQSSVGAFMGMMMMMQQPPPGMQQPGQQPPTFE